MFFIVMFYVVVFFIQFYLYSTLTIDLVSSFPKSWMQISIANEQFRGTCNSRRFTLESIEVGMRLVFLCIAHLDSFPSSVLWTNILLITENKR